MTAEHGIWSPDETIVRWALLSGVVGFLGGFIGPMYLSDSNLGPLLGFLTGPVGAFAGVFVGVARSAKFAAPSFMPTIAGRFFGAWLLVLLCTLFMGNLIARALLLGAAVLAMAAASAIYVFSQRDIRQKWSLTTRRRAPLAIAALALILILTVFPPVMRNVTLVAGRPQTPQPAANDDSQEPLPRFLFVLDDRLDTSRRVPPLAANVPMLALEWVAVAAATSLFGWLLIRPKAD